MTVLENNLETSMEFIMNVANGVELSDEIMNVTMKMETEGYKSLTAEEKELFKGYTSKIHKAIFNSEMMKHAAVVVQMYDKKLGELIKDADWTVIDSPIKNKNDMDEFEVKRITKALEKLDLVGRANNPTQESGFDENGRPYTRHEVGDLRSMLYLDTHEYVFTEA